MASHGIEGLIVETRNWGRTVAFWQALGYRVQFETGRNSGRLEHPFAGRHWGSAEMMLRDPDGRHVSVQAPTPAVAVEPAEQP